jgi:hypothetical protein
MRDYLRDMSEYLGEVVPEGEYVAQLVAQNIVNVLLEEDKDLLIGWLTLKAPAILTDVIVRRSNGRRHTLKIHRQRDEFSQAAEKYEKDRDPAHLRPFTFEYVVSSDNLRRKVGQMTAGDCLFVADMYDDLARNAKMRSAFHRAVARRLAPGQTVEDAFTEEAYLRMYHSIVGGGPTTAVSPPKALPS